MLLLIVLLNKLICFIFMNCEDIVVDRIHLKPIELVSHCLGAKTKSLRLIFTSDWWDFDWLVPLWWISLFDSKTNQIIKWAVRNSLLIRKMSQLQFVFFKCIIVFAGKFIHYRTNYSKYCFCSVCCSFLFGNSIVLHEFLSFLVPLWIRGNPVNVLVPCVLCDTYVTVIFMWIVYSLLVTINC